MKNFTKTVAALSLAAMTGTFTACGESDKTVGITEEAAGIADNDLSSDSKDPESSSSAEEKPFSGKITGVSQKGPFLVGSTVTLHEVDGESFGLSGRSFPDNIKNDEGEFEIPFKNLTSKFALLVADGYYRNENTGKKSTAPIKLNALSDLSDRSTVNVNLFTHLEYYRIKHLILEKGMEYSKAKSQAEKEILKAFNISVEKNTEAENLSIFGESENDGALLALSVLMQGRSEEGEFSERLALIAQDLEEEGKINNKQILADIADGVALLDLKTIKQNILDWKISNKLPAFESYVESYWTNNYEIGDCSEANLGHTADNKNELSKNYKTVYVCDEDGWREQTADEKKYGACSAANDGDRYEDVLICTNGSWKDMGPEVKVGECTEELYGETVIFDNSLSSYYNKHYVCDKNGWRVMENFERNGNACTAAEKDQNKLYNGGTFYLICRNGEWEGLSEEDFDMYSIKCEKDGDTHYSETTSQYYICKDGTPSKMAAEDFVVNKEFTADIWNAVSNEKAALKEGTSTYVFVGGTSVTVFDAKNNPIDKTNFTSVKEEEAISLFGDKGISLGFELRKRTFSDIGVGVAFSNGKDDVEIDATSLKGLCAVYASTTPVYLYIGNASGGGLKAKLPASTELTTANIKWEEMEFDFVKSADEVLPKAHYLTITAEAYNSEKAITGALYVGGIGKYNGCSIK